MTELSAVADSDDRFKNDSQTTNGFIFKKIHELHYISNFKIIYGVFLGE
jgi:hypothetical protein